jgi:hypothetical protein
MTYKINDQVSIKIEVTPVATGGAFVERDSVPDDKWFEIPLQFGNSLGTMHISAGSNSKLPACEFTIVDELRFFDTFAETVAPGITDGALFRISITGAETVVRYFRVYNWSRASSGGTGFSYSFVCYWDSVKYWCKRAVTPQQAPSSVVLNSIADDCKLEWWSENDQTSDAMLWQPHNRFFGDWAKEVAGAGWKSNTSHMVLGVDSTGRMRYKDVNRDLSSAQMVTLSQLRPVLDEFNHLIQDFNAKIGAGMYNTSGGYWHDRYLQNMSTLGESLSKDDLETSSALVKDSNLMLRSEAVIEYIAASVVSFSPIDFKQVGENYERGRWQNTRYNLLNCVTGEFMFTYPTKWEVTDYFEYASPSLLADQTYNGQYTVACKTILISGGGYYEKVTGLRTGLKPLKED